jgi:hypothetical protein
MVLSVSLGFLDVCGSADQELDFGAFDLCDILRELVDDLLVKRCKLAFGFLKVFELSVVPCSLCF